MTEGLLLEAHEELLWTGRPRLSAAAGSIAGGLALVALGAAGLATRGPDADLTAVAVLALLILAGIATPLSRLLALRRTRYAVSDRALYARSGVLSREVRRMSLDRVQNSAFGQGVLGGVFGYGTVTVESAGGGSPLRFVRIETPGEVRALVDRRVALAADPIPGTVEQWASVLAEVRALRTGIERRGGLG